MILHIPYTDPISTPLRLFNHPTAAKILSPGGHLAVDIKQYRSNLIKAIEDEKVKLGSALIIDCKILAPDEKDHSLPYRDICIGSDPFHTPLALVFSAVKHFRAHGYSVSVNKPLSGTYVPMKYFQVDKHVCSMRIEIDADLYKDSLEPLQSDLNSWLTGYLEKS